jgi:putative membrane protein
MKPEFISISRFAIIATMAGSLSVIGTIRAQEGKEDTGIGSNPHLRAKSAPTPPSSGTVTVKLSQKDVSFIQKAGGGGQQEVENGKMAEKQGKSADVKRIGARMVADHTKANKELTELANRKGVKFDTRGVRAQNIGAADFDRQYLKLLEVDHKSDIAEFQKEATSGDDRDLKAWASKTLPMLKEHLAMVEDAMRKVK